MTSLSPESRSIIDAAHDADGLDDVARARMKRRVLARVAAGAAAAGATAVVGQAAAKTAGGALSAGLLTKLGVSLVLAGVVGVGSYNAVTSVSSAPVPVVQASAPEPATVVAPVPVVDAPALAPEAASPESAPAAEEPPPAAPAVSPPASAAKPSASSLASETALLQRAQAELASGNPQEALALLDRHGSEHQSGALREERQAARVLALCHAGRGHEARTAAQRFAAEFPKSVHRARVLSACASDEPAN